MEKTTTAGAAIIASTATFFLFLFFIYVPLTLAADFYWTGDTAYSDGDFETDGTAALLFGSYRNYYGCFLPDVPSFNLEQISVYINEHSAFGHTKIYICPTRHDKFSVANCKPGGKEMEKILNVTYCSSTLTYLGEFNLGQFNAGWNTLSFFPYWIEGGNYILWSHNQDAEGNDISNVDSSDNFYFYRSEYSCTENYAMLRNLCNIKLGGTEKPKITTTTTLIKTKPTTNPTITIKTTTTRTHSECAICNISSANLGIVVVFILVLTAVIGLRLKSKGKTKEK